MVDTSLLLTISQASATFVAILAGFYTTKVLSISSEKKRLHSKTKDIDNDLKLGSRIVDDLTTEIDNIDNRWDEEKVESFAKYLVARPFYSNDITTFEDIKGRFKEFYGQSPSENELKILENKSSSIIEEIQKYKQEKTVKLTALPSQSEQFRRVLHDTDDEQNRNKLYYRRNTEESRISILKELKATHENDWKLLMYPKYVKFGYSSFIIFAICGAIFPLTYRWWPLYLLNHSEIFGLSAFGIGLILTFLYLGLELRYAFSNDNKI